MAIKPVSSHVLTALVCAERRARLYSGNKLTPPAPSHAAGDALAAGFAGADSGAAKGAGEQQGTPQTSPQNIPSGQAHGSVRISLDEAIQKALQNNHTLKAARTTIQQNEAQEITANLRPNPVLTVDSQFLPIFPPSEFSADYINTTAQFDVGAFVSFRTRKEAATPLQAAEDATAQTKATVTDNERTLVFQRIVAILDARSWPSLRSIWLCRT